MSLEHCPAVIIVFAMRGCPACDEYKPRLEREIKRWQTQGAPLVIGKGLHDETFQRWQIPVFFLDAESEDPQLQGLADQHQVSGLPTTVLFTGWAKPEKIEGAIGDPEIYDLLRRATRT